MTDSTDDLTDLQYRCLEDLVRTTSCVRRWFENAVGDPTDPGPDAKWSISEHALHCILAMESVVAGFAREDALVDTREFSAARLAVLTTWRVPDGAEAPRFVVPHVILPAEEVTERLEQARDALLPLIREMGDREPVGYLNHFALGPMSREEWFRFLLIHVKHHDRLLDARRQIRR